MPRIVSVPTRDEREVLEQLYLKKGLPVEEIAKKLNISPRTLFMKLKVHGLTVSKKTRTPSYCGSCGVHLEWLETKTKSTKRRSIRRAKK